MAKTHFQSQANNAMFFFCLANHSELLTILNIHKRSLISNHVAACLGRGGVSKDIETGVKVYWWYWAEWQVTGLMAKQHLSNTSDYSGQ